MPKFRNAGLMSCDPGRSRK